MRAVTLEPSQIATSAASKRVIDRRIGVGTNLQDFRRQGTCGSTSVSALTTSFGPNCEATRYAPAVVCR